MSTNKPAKPRRAGSSAFPKQKPQLRLLKPDQECATTDIITELSQEVKVMLGEQKRRRVVVQDDDAPDAA